MMIVGDVAITTMIVGDVAITTKGYVWRPQTGKGTQ